VIDVAHDLTTDAIDEIDEIDEIAPDFTRIDVGHRFPKAKIVPPTTAGYLLVAAEIDRRPMFLPNSRRKRALLRQLGAVIRELRRDPRVVEAVAFDGVLSPARPGEVLDDRPDVTVARFDVAVLVETTSLEDASRVEREVQWQTLLRLLTDRARGSYSLRARNVRRLGPVDHDRNGVFLFNYFYADRTDLNLAAWQYTAGWFQDQTGLDNSTVLLPEASTEPRYRLVNHARWDRLTNVLLSLIFKRSFRTYVLRHFSANGVAAMPVLYKRVSEAR
jgi:hypothetical protein